MRIIRAFLGSPLAIVCVLGLAAFLRIYQVSEWSLWEDEETSLYFSQQPDRPFPRFFPVFFYALNGLFRVTGVSVAAGRLLAGAAGVFGVWLLYVFVRRWVSREAALLAAFLLALNLGHLFWSQSIRYYTLVFALQLLCSYWFLDGFETGRSRSLWLANLAFALALLTHFSAVLLAPVLVGYLALMIWRRESEGGYGCRGYLTFGLPFAAVMAAFAVRLFQMRSIMAGWPGRESARSPLHLLLTVVAYFGVPAIGLGLLAPLVARRVPSRILLFLLTGSVVPILEIVVIGRLNITNVTWYYALFALAGFLALLSAGLVALYQGGRRKVAALLGGGACLYYALFAVAYFTTMQGDRPRWRDAAAWLTETASVKDSENDGPQVYATVPGVVAYYLGAPPGETMGNPLVKDWHEGPPKPGEDAWCVFDAGTVTPEYGAWLSQHADLVARFEAHTGPVDRSVLVYRSK